MKSLLCKKWPGIPETKEYINQTTYDELTSCTTFWSCSYNKPQQAGEREVVGSIGKNIPIIPKNREILPIDINKILFIKTIKPGVLLINRIPAFFSYQTSVRAVLIKLRQYPFHKSYPPADSF